MARRKWTPSLAEWFALRQVQQSPKTAKGDARFLDCLLHWVRTNNTAAIKAAGRALRGESIGRSVRTSTRSRGKPPRDLPRAARLALMHNNLAARFTDLRKTLNPDALKKELVDKKFCPDVIRAVLMGREKRAATLCLKHVCRCSERTLAGLLAEGRQPANWDTLFRDPEKLAEFLAPHSWSVVLFDRLPAWDRLVDLAKQEFPSTLLYQA